MRLEMTILAGTRVGATSLSDCQLPTMIPTDQNDETSAIGSPEHIRICTPSLYTLLTTLYSGLENCRLRVSSFLPFLTRTSHTPRVDSDIDANRFPLLLMVIFVIGSLPSGNGAASILAAVVGQYMASLKMVL